LIGSTSTTKKVQTIFEEAQKLREKERVEDIELSWRSSEQRPLEKRSEDIPEKTEPKAKPVKTALPEAMLPQKPRRGRPPKSGKPQEDPKPVNDPEAMTTAGKAGKRQRSLFDF